MTYPYEWDGTARCFVINTPSGKRPADPVMWHTSRKGELLEVSRRTPSNGPFDLISTCIDTGLPVGRPRTFTSFHAAKMAALGDQL